MHLLGFEAGIRVPGPRARVLQEYEPRLKTETEMVCWLEAEAGETFEVFWKNTNKAKKSTAGEVCFAPEKRAPGAGALKQWAMPDGVVGYEMTFTWSYRSRVALQIHYVIPRDPVVAPALSPPPYDPERERPASIPQVKREPSIDFSRQDQPVAGPSRPSFRGGSPEVIVLSDSDSESPLPRPRRVLTPPHPPSPKRVKREMSPIVFTMENGLAQSPREDPIELSSDDDTAVEFVSRKKMQKNAQIAEETRREKIKADKIASRQKAQEANADKLRTQQLGQAEKVRLLKEMRDKAAAEEERLLADLL